MSPAESDAAVELVMQLLAIPGKSCQEGAVAKFLVEQLRASGLSDSEFTFDDTHKKSPFGGETGNLIVKLPGTVRGPRRLLMAHMDTVPLCVGCQPVREGNVIRSARPETALGGDDRAGVAVLLHTLKTIRQQNLPHPPLTFLWVVQEEIGLVGARHVSVNKLGKPKLCFNWDGGPAHLATIGATGDDHMEIEVTGRASHAGAHPEQGISAIAIASQAITSLVADGWFGKVTRGRKSGTSNIGVIQGGDATNVVTDKVRLKAEARSHDPAFRAKIVKAYEQAFRKAAREAPNTDGERGGVTFTATHKYESFRLAEDSEVVQAALEAMKAVGLTPETRISNGGLDANWMTAHGLPTVTLGCGQSGIHTVREELLVDVFLDACRVAMVIAAEGRG